MSAESLKPSTPDPDEQAEPNAIPADRCGWEVAVLQGEVCFGRLLAPEPLVIWLTVAVLTMIGAACFVWLGLHMFQHPDPGSSSFQRYINLKASLFILVVGVISLGIGFGRPRQRKLLITISNKKLTVQHGNRAPRSWSIHHPSLFRLETRKSLLRSGRLSYQLQMQSKPGRFIRICSFKSSQQGHWIADSLNKTRVP